MSASQRVIAFVGLGSNMGEREHYLDAALGAMGQLPETQIDKCSDRFESEPVDYTDQPWFLNQVVQLSTGLAPHALLSEILAIEDANGRVRTRRWGPRTLDLDLLLYGDVRLDDERLQLPHPRLTQRAFVVVPLAELAPELHVDGRPLREWAAVLREQRLRRWGA